MKKKKSLTMVRNKEKILSTTGGSKTFHHFKLTYRENFKQMTTESSTLA